MEEGKIMKPEVRVWVVRRVRYDWRQLTQVDWGDVHDRAVNHWQSHDSV